MLLLSVGLCAFNGYCGVVAGDAATTTTDLNDVAADEDAEFWERFLGHYVKKKKKKKPTPVVMSLPVSRKDLFPRHPSYDCRIHQPAVVIILVEKEC